jgi:hypothetical protein
MKMNSSLFVAIALTLAIAPISGLASNYINNRIAFQGLLRQVGGLPVPDGTYLVQINVHTGGVADAVVWSKNGISVSTTNGIFSVILSGSGNVAPGNVPLTSAIFDISAADLTKSLQVDVLADLNGGPSGDGVYESQFLSIPIMAVPTAMVADRCNLAAGVAAGVLGDANMAATSITLGKLAASGATSGQVASWNGSAWAPVTLSGFSGSLSGDVTGTQGATVVGKIQGVTVSSTAPAIGQFLKYNGTNWIPAAGTTYTAGSGIAINGSNAVSASGIVSTNMAADDYSTILNNTSPYSINITGNSATATSATTVSGTVAIANGGTGGTTALSARAALSAAQNGANGDITSLSALSTALSIGQGGTGGATAATARTSLGVPATAAVQDGSILFASDTGAANAYVITLGTVPAAYTTGMEIRFKATNANSGASTINVNALGLKSIKKQSATALASGDILAGQIVVLDYDGTNFQMQSQTAAVGSSGITALTGDVTATGPGSAGATVALVGGATAANVATSVTSTTNATTANTINTIVKRDGTGSFSAGTITAVTAVNSVDVGSTGNFSQTGAGTFGTATGAVSLNGNTTIAGAKTFSSGTGAVTLNGATTVSGTNTFSTGTGVFGINGATTVASGVGVTFMGGASNFDQSASTGTFATSSGSVNLNGNTTIAGAKTFSTGTGAVTLNGATTISGTNTFATGTGNVTLNGATTVSGVNTLSSGTGAVTLNGATSVAGANTFTTGTGGVTIGAGVNSGYTGGGTANAETVTLVPAITALTTGLTVNFKAVGTNTGATTLAVNGLAAKAVFWGNAAVTGGELLSGNWYTVMYDGTEFQMLSPMRLAGSASIAAASLNSGSALTASTAFDSTSTVSVTGAIAGDTVTCSPSASPGNGIVWTSYVSAANTVTIRYGCQNGASTCTVATTTQKCQVFR